MDYSASVWGYKNYSQLDSVQNRAIRYFLGVHRFTPNMAILGDTGWLPCIYRRWFAILKFWNRLILLDDSRLTKKVFNFDYEINHSNWCTDVKDIMDKLNLSVYFENRSVVDMGLVQNKIHYYFATSWPEKCRNVPKLRTYNLFKHSFKTEEYVTLNLKRNERSIMAQFRCGVLPLRVETGRFIGEPVQNRLCQMCNLGLIEDEKHFLLFCPFYTCCREQEYSNIILSDNFIQMSDDDKLSFLLNIHIRKTAKYLLRAYLKRRNAIFCRR